MCVFIVFFSENKTRNKYLQKNVKILQSNVIKQKKEQIMTESEVFGAEQTQFAQLPRKNYISILIKFLVSNDIIAVTERDVFLVSVFRGTHV